MYTSIDSTNCVANMHRYAGCCIAFQVIINWKNDNPEFQSSRNPGGTFEYGHNDHFVLEDPEIAYGIVSSSPTNFYNIGNAYNLSILRPINSTRLNAYNAISPDTLNRGGWSLTLKVRKITDLEFEMIKESLAKKECKFNI